MLYSDKVTQSNKKENITRKCSKTRHVGTIQLMKDITKSDKSLVLFFQQRDLSKTIISNEKLAQKINLTKLNS